MDGLLSISDVVRQTGLTAHTLRYYERIGLINAVGRGTGGQRRYAASDLDWIRFLMRLRDTRMPIGQMQAFANLRRQGDATTSERKALLEQHLTQVLMNIEAMQLAAQVLQAKVAYYQGQERTRHDRQHR